MAAFEKVLSGMPALDQAVDYIRMGDNVVWRVSSLEEFRCFAVPFVEQAKKDGRNIIYFRFASHPELVPECPEVKRVCIPLSHRFETFTVEIHRVIEQEGRDAFYVFDCLSELQTAWATDLMILLSFLLVNLRQIGNNLRCQQFPIGFFVVQCPHLIAPFRFQHRHLSIIWLHCIIKTAKNQFNTAILSGNGGISRKDGGINL